jgi:hypothetical protein
MSDETNDEMNGLLRRRRGRSAPVDGDDAGDRRTPGSVDAGAGGRDDLSPEQLRAWRSEQMNHALRERVDQRRFAPKGPDA